MNCINLGSNNYHLENVPQRVPFISGGYEIDERVWDEFYGHVMSCETCPDIEKMRRNHNRDFMASVVGGIICAIGLGMLLAGALMMIITDDEDTAGDCIDGRFGSIAVGVIVFIISYTDDRKNRRKWMKHVCTELPLKLKHLNTKYDGKMNFILGQFNLQITIEVKVLNVIFPESVL